MKKEFVELKTMKAEMEKFAKGLMWVMKTALGMPEQWMLWEPDRKEGEYILKQIMMGEILVIMMKD